MKKNKTIREWLETLPDGYRELAIKNCDGPPAKSLPYAILEAFSWRNSPEGYDFWYDVYYWAYGDGELPPLPEEEK